MALYINKTQNSIVFNEEDFEIDTNYMPEIVLALMELNPEKTMHFGIDLPETPAIFVLYINKILKENPTIDIKLYHRDTSEILKLSLKSFGIEYHNIKDMV